jgi:hypothetical protein
MKVIEILNFNRELLTRLLESGLEDVRYVNLYTDYFHLLRAGEKMTYIVAILAERYGISERKVYGLIKRFQSDCKPLTV